MKEIVAVATNRRSFLFGRESTADDEWSRFLVRIKADCLGEVRLVTSSQALLQPATLEDVLQARGLCQEYGVGMALHGLALPQADAQRKVLWVEAGKHWASLLPLGDSGLWRVDAGCLTTVMRAAGLLNENSAPALQNLALWFAQTAIHTPLRDIVGLEQLVSVDWLLPDGTIEVFGPFGMHDSCPLASVSAQRLVPKLFECAMSLRASELCDKPIWAPRFHLDALFDIDNVNLAHLLLGSGGALGWLVAATFRRTENVANRIGQTGSSYQDTPALIDIDVQVKALFDPSAVFISP
jgi:hypothetical protein